jgi:hypothetical protein
MAEIRIKRVKRMTMHFTRNTLHVITDKSYAIIGWCLGKGLLCLWPRVVKLDRISNLQQLPYHIT